jgi:hypothetical protein
MSSSRRAFPRAAREVKLSEKNQQQQLFDDVHAALGRLNRANSGASLGAAPPTPDVANSLTLAGQAHDNEQDDREREQSQEAKSPQRRDHQAAQDTRADIATVTNALQQLMALDVSSGILGGGGVSAVQPSRPSTAARQDQPLADPPRLPPAPYVDETGEDQDPDDPNGHQRGLRSRYEQAKARLLGQDMSDAFLHKAAALVHLTDEATPMEITMAATQHARSDQRLYADLIHAGSIVQAMYDDDPFAFDRAVRRLWQLVAVAVRGPAMWEVGEALGRTRVKVSAIPDGFESVAIDMLRFQSTLDRALPPQSNRRGRDHGPARPLRRAAQQGQYYGRPPAAYFYPPGPSGQAYEEGIRAPFGGDARYGRSDQGHSRTHDRPRHFAPSSFSQRGGASFGHRGGRAGNYNNGAPRGFSNPPDYSSAYFDNLFDDSDGTTRSLSRGRMQAHGRRN